MAEYFHHFAKIRQVYPHLEPDLVSSHNDLNPNNILFDGDRLWAVDWEAAFANDRYVDLAIVTNNFVSDDDAEQVFLSTYFDGPASHYQRARFFLMRQVCHLFFAMAFLRFAAAHKPACAMVDADMTAPRLKEFYLLFRTGKVSLSTCDGSVAVR